jgi:long-chain fatty acid transport protein
MAIRRFFSILSFALVFCIGFSAHATDGMNPIAFDAETAAMGGASTALHRSALAITSNPAGISQVGTRFDLNVTLLAPSLTLNDRVQTPQGLMPLNTNLDGDRSVFPLFGVAFSMPVIKDTLYAGFGIFVQGGMGATFNGLNTFVDENPQENLTGQPTPATYKTDSRIMFIKFAPSIAYRYKNIAVGASLHVGVAKMDFTHTGMQFPEPDSDGVFMANTLDYESDFAFGIAGRFGALVNLFNDNLTLGVSYQMQAKPSFDGTMKINGFEYEGGTDDFGWARELSFGVAARFLEKRLTVAADFRWVNWSQAVDTVTFNVKAKDPGSLPPGMAPEMPLPFQMKWQDTLVVAAGAEYALLKDKVFLRAGYNYGRAPATAVGINPLFPPVTEHHVTGGVGLKNIIKGLSLNVAFEVGLEGEAKSNNENQLAFQPTQPPATPQPNGYSVDVAMSQLSFYISAAYEL